MQVYLHRVDVPALVAQLNELGVGWVKAQVSWKLFQPYPDQFSEERFAGKRGRNLAKILCRFCRQ